MKKEITVAVVAAVAGAITTALLGMIQVVSPLKDDLKVSLSEKNILEGKLQKYMYGETISVAKTDNFSFELASVKRTKYESIIVTVLVSNLTDEARGFYVIRKRTSIQTETLDAYSVKQVSVLTTGMSNKKVVGMPIPQGAKHVPVSIEVSSVNPNAKFLTALNLSFGNNIYGNNESLVVFNDLSIPEK